MAGLAADGLREQHVKLAKFLKRVPSKHDQVNAVQNVGAVRP